MFLAQSAIQAAIAKKEIIIDPFVPEAVGPGSVDLSLGNQFRFVRPAERVVLGEDVDFTKYSELQTLDELVLAPGAFVLALTKERLTLPHNICGFISGRTRFARVGLFVHASADFMQPGIDKVPQVLELFNASSNTLVLHPGDKVCQVMFARMEGEGNYQGPWEDGHNSFI